MEAQVTYSKNDKGNTVYDFCHFGSIELCDTYLNFFNTLTGERAKIYYSNIISVGSSDGNPLTAPSLRINTAGRNYVITLMFPGYIQGFSYVASQIDDLVHRKNESVHTVQNTDNNRFTPIVVNSENYKPLMKRVYMLLEDEEWEKADFYCEQALNYKPTDGIIYLAKLMAELHICKIEDLKNCAHPFDSEDVNACPVCGYTDYNEYIPANCPVCGTAGDRFVKKAEKVPGSDNCRKASKYNPKIADQLKMYNKCIRERNESKRLAETYDDAVSEMNKGHYKQAADEFRKIPGYKNANELKNSCLEKDEETYKNGIYTEAEGLLSNDTISDCEKAEQLFESIIGWKDSKERSEQCKKRIEKIQAEEKNSKQKKKRLMIFAIAGLLVLVIFIIVLVSVIIPETKLNKAMEEIDAGEYDSAYAIIEELNKTEPANSKIYEKAVSLAESGNTDPALKLFSQIIGYKDSDSQIKDIYEEEYKNIEVGSIVTFGNYYQSSSDYKEKIEWKVLDIQNGKALLLSSFILDSVPYNEDENEVTWETCSLRKWLNQTFLNEAFSKSEQLIISDTQVTAETNWEASSPGNNTVDKIYLLSEKELIGYFGIDGMEMAIPTDYAIYNGAYNNRDFDRKSEYMWWILRDHGIDSDNGICVLDGGLGGYTITSEGCIRPVMWIEID